jgi:hypothetical protein
LGQGVSHRSRITGDRRDRQGWDRQGWYCHAIIMPSRRPQVGS